VPDDVEIRLLRTFAVVGEELHFSRAAQRLFLAQQSVSRDIRRLEDRLGARLLNRSTRHVALTPEGTTLLARAREILALYDATVRELRGEFRSLTVDVVGPGLTPALVLAAAREIAPDIEFFARYYTGTQAVVPLLDAGRIDVTFGRDPDPPAGSAHRAVRHEPIGVLLPEQSPFAAKSEVPLEALRGCRPCVRAGDHATPGWEHAVLQLLAPSGIDPAAAHPHVHGAAEVQQHIRTRSAPILTLTTQPPVPGTILRPLSEPAAMFPWAMYWRDGTDHPGLTALHRAIDALASEHDWLSLPAGAWLPQPESARERTHRDEALDING
jgi:DNA-binding transcriptional LysR family regulator